MKKTANGEASPLGSLGAEMLCGGVPEESRKASREAELRGTPSDGGAPTENIAATRGADLPHSDGRRETAVKMP